MDSFSTLSFNHSSGYLTRWNKQQSITEWQKKITDFYDNLSVDFASSQQPVNILNENSVINISGLCNLCINLEPLVPLLIKEININPLALMLSNQAQQTFGKLQESLVIARQNFIDYTTSLTSGLTAAPPTTANPNQVEELTDTTTDDTLIFLMLLCIEIYQEATRTIAIFADNADKHKQILANLNDYSYAFHQLANAMINNPDCRYLNDLFNKAVATTSSGSLVNPQLYEELMPLAALLGISYNPGDVYFGQEIELALANLFIRINADITTIGAEVLQTPYITNVDPSGISTTTAITYTPLGSTSYCYMSPTGEVYYADVYTGNTITLPPDYTTAYTYQYTADEYSETKTITTSMNGNTISTTTNSGVVYIPSGGVPANSVITTYSPITNIEIDPAKLQDNQESLDIAIVVAGEVSQEEARYLEALQLNLLMQMNLINQTASSIDKIGQALFS